MLITFYKESHHRLVFKGQILGLVNIAVHSSAKIQSNGNGRKNKISALPSVRAALSDHFIVLTHYLPPNLWEPRVSEEQKDEISCSMG